MSLKVKALLLTIMLIVQVSCTNFQYYPEDITMWDIIDNSSNEHLLVAYYFTDPSTSLPGTKLYDYQNGVIAYPFNDVNLK
jgi:hypothetical protein